MRERPAVYAYYGSPVPQRSYRKSLVLGLAACVVLGGAIGIGIGWRLVGILPHRSSRRGIPSHAERSAS